MLVLLFSGLFLSSLFGQVTAPETVALEPAQQALAQRAETFWQAQVQGDWERVFEFWTPNGFAPMTVEEFVLDKRTKGPMVFHEAEILDSRTDGDFGWVKVRHVSSLFARRSQTRDGSLDSVAEGWRALVSGSAGSREVVPETAATPEAAR